MVMEVVVFGEVLQTVELIKVMLPLTLKLLKVMAEVVGLLKIPLLVFIGGVVMVVMVLLLLKNIHREKK
jgi:hypothetical protein